MRNMRKVKINAQVAFALYILETVGQVLVFVLWIIIGQTEAGMTLAVTLYYVVLPYTFLMNTSHNKNLLIDYGWMNTIRNVLGPLTETRLIFVQALVRYTNILRSSIHNKRNRTEQERTINDEQGKQNGPDAKDHLHHTDVESRSCGGQASDIYMISKTTENNLVQERKDYIPEEEPCAYSAVLMFNGEQKETKLPEDNCSGSDDNNDDDRNIHHGNYRLFFAEKILSLITININNEDAYLHYINQLAKLEDANNDKNFVLPEFQITSFTTAPTPKQGKIKSSNNQAKNTASLSKTKTLKGQKIESEAKLLGPFSERLYKRTAALENFHEHCNDDNSLDMFLKKIFDLEESLIS